MEFTRELPSLIFVPQATINEKFYSYVIIYYERENSYFFAFIIIWYEYHW